MFSSIIPCWILLLIVNSETSLFHRAMPVIPFINLATTVNNTYDRQQLRLNNRYSLVSEACENRFFEQTFD